MKTLTLVVSLALAGCKPGWNDPKPITPEPDNPCGLDWHSCGNGKCCPDDHACRPNGYCAFVGGPGPTWGATRDAGANVAPPEVPQLTPDQIRRGRP
jgi:hypothetical protein